MTSCFSHYCTVNHIFLSKYPVLSFSQKIKKMNYQFSIKIWRQFSLDDCIKQYKFVRVYTIYSIVLLQLHYILHAQNISHTRPESTYRNGCPPAPGPWWLRWSHFRDTGQACLFSIRFHRLKLIFSFWALMILCMSTQLQLFSFYMIFT